ncbi:autotransporter outer membrane beta-barrel domain-containing protein [Bartonella doshiae]|uniref:autotransporter outer membrane beta-barrel domain-containing protein n=1 Tax=Bartonella doshiae TaxID=33044 RepID=UPI001FED93C2|nr:autotransporter outer membrane beta-barrel domain-containing protein [Bartonella doshiae]
MSKKSLLSCTTAAVIILFGPHNNLQAAGKFKAGKGEIKTASTGATYEELQTLDGGKIYGTNLVIIGNKDTNKPTMEFAVSAKENGSYIELWNTTIKGTDSNIFRGLEAKNNAAIKMTGGSITATAFAVSFFDSRPSGNENMLENVNVSSIGSEPQYEAISAYNSYLTLKNVTASASNALVVRKNAYVTVSGGSFNGQVNANGGGSITLKDNVKITSNEYGLCVKDPESWVQMIGGEITGKGIAALAENKTRITLTDVTIKAGGSGTGVNSINSMIELNGNTEIKDASVGLLVEGIDGQIKVHGSKNNPSKITGNKYALEAEINGHLFAENVTIKANRNGIGAYAYSPEEPSTNRFSIIELSGNTEITDALIGLKAVGNGRIKVHGSKDLFSNAPIKITGKEIGLNAEYGGHITATDVLIKTSDFGNGVGAIAIDKNSMIELNGNTEITDVLIGLLTVDGGEIKITGSKDSPIKITGKEIGLDAENGGHITATDVLIKTNNFGIEIGAIATDKNSMIELSGNTEITNVVIGLLAQADSQIKVTGSKDNPIKITGKQTAVLTGTSLNGNKANGGSITITDVVLKTNGNGIGASANSQNSMINLQNTTIDDVSIGIEANDGAIIKLNQGVITTIGTGASFNNSKSNENKLENLVIASHNYENLTKVGINTFESKVALKNVTVKNAENGINADSHSEIAISGGIFDTEISSIKAQNDSTITLNDNVTVISYGDALHAEGINSKITMIEGNVKAKEAAFVVKDGGQIDGRKITAEAKNNGIRFDKSQKDKISQINLTHTTLQVENGVGISSQGSTGKVNLKDSEIHADRLFMGITHDAPQHDETFTLSTENSLLQGGVKNDENGRTTFDLKNDTTWFLKTSTQEKDQNGDLLDIAQRSRSDVSVLNLNDSKIVFEKPVENHYHTLHIGLGKNDTPEVYNASGNAAIHFNMAWSDGVAVDDQKADRVLIHGDASGTTTVYVMSDVGDRSNVENTGSPSNTGGISLIQVSGKATEDSFKLANGYITRDGSPYKYTLTAYGPTSSHGIANSEQNLFEEKNENFWDFRLHKAFLNSGSGSTGIPAPVAQTASYLDMPIALFHAGFADIKEQSTLLADIKTTQNFSFFLSPYGNTAKFTSKRGPLKYGYDADINYTAIQAGAALAEIENKDISMHLGLMGTYGQLSFTPKDIEDADKSSLNKWAITAYGTLQHNNGLYLDILASYGMISGDITTKALKNAASVKDTNTWSASATVGKEFAMNHEGLTLEPQVQLVYQQLSFEKIKDADELKVDLKNPSQWLARIGGRLTKTVSSTEQSHTTSVYGKLNFLTAFGDEDTIQIGKDFNLDPTGTSLEGGVGINANLSQNFSIHADVSYRQKLQKAGISGADFSAGIRYQF